MTREPTLRLRDRVVRLIDADTREPDRPFWARGAESWRFVSASPRRPGEGIDRVQCQR